MTVEQAKARNISVLDNPPEGWRRIEGAMTAPLGYVWYSNGKSHWDKDYTTALVKDPRHG